MRIYGFELLHERAIWEGYVTAENEEEARQKILNKEWDDVMSMIRKKLNKKEKVEKVKFVRKVSSGITYM